MLASQQNKFYPAFVGMTVIPRWPLATVTVQPLESWFGSVAVAVVSGCPLTTIGPQNLDALSGTTAVAGPSCREHAAAHP